MKRREFLKGTSAVALTARVPFANAGSADATPPRGQTFDREQWAVIETVHDHLLPSEADAPGARDVKAAAYLDRAMADPKFDPEVKSFVLDGIGWLNEIAEQQQGQPFPAVEPGPREDLLRQIAASGAGERWVSTLISYVLEALLADPLYGGNRDGIGWKWLEHDPGRPRPTPDKIYGRLGRT